MMAKVICAVLIFPLYCECNKIIQMFTPPNKNQRDKEAILAHMLILAALNQLRFIHQFLHSSPSFSYTDLGHSVLTLLSASVTF